MKFEDMKKIWDEQKQQHLYVIDEKLLHENILAKKRGASRFINRMEWLAIFANLFAGGVIITANMYSHPGAVYVNFTGIVMIAAAVYFFIRRLIRIKNDNQFDRTMLGDLEHAIRNASYRAQLSFILLMYWIIFGILFVIVFIQEGKSLLQISLAIVFCIVVWFLGRWEHRSWHLANKKRLEAMRKKLIESV